MAVRARRPFRNVFEHAETRTRRGPREPFLANEGPHLDSALAQNRPVAQGVQAPQICDGVEDVQSQKQVREDEERPVGRRRRRRFHRVCGRREEEREEEESVDGHGCCGVDSHAGGSAQNDPAFAGLRPLHPRLARQKPFCLPRVDVGHAPCLSRYVARARSRPEGVDASIRALFRMLCAPSRTVHALLRIASCGRRRGCQPRRAYAVPDPHTPGPHAQPL